MLDHFGPEISREQTCKWGIEWDTCAPQSRNSKNERFGGSRHSDEEKFRSDLYRPKGWD
jgi:hypothetical protein